MPAERWEWNTEGLKIGWINRAFLATSSDADDPAEDGRLLDKWKEVGDKSYASIIVQGG